MKKNYLCSTVLMLFFVQFLIAQSVTISGTVTDDFGETIPGVTVQIKNSNKGAVTDFSGNYTLQANVKSGSNTLLFRSIGYSTKEILFTYESQLEIVLDAVMSADILGLDEVVITGVGALTAKSKSVM